LLSSEVRGDEKVSYRNLKFFSIIIPTIIIGGFEFMRHSIFLHNLSMEAGNYLITFLTFIISFAFASWMFHTIEKKNQRITEEREMGAIYEERERLAKELHDSIAQTLFLLKVQLKKGKIEEASALVNTIDTNLRQAIFNLRISPKEHISFTKRIQNWLEDWITITGIDIHMEMNMKDNYFSSAEEMQLFGIIQEVFANIRKHSEANEVSFSLNTLHTDWEMVIKDNGKGFNLTDIPPNKYGMSMLKERSEKLHSSFEIVTKEKLGTKIILRGNK
jgi:nitrate/nitrite-specific signal transduction histidine kinase